MLDEGRPVYTIGTAAEILHVHPRTLRLYEDGGLIRPARKNNRRFYSANDLKWVNCIRYMIHEKGLNQEGLRRLLGMAPCCDIKGCSPEQRAACAAPVNRTTPCWDLARKAGNESKRCWECGVYLSAAERLLNKTDLAAAFDYQTSD
jgi:MerR family transcriptional regulator, heat shock protein HspR